MNRRQFLGAAAVLATLPTDTGTAAADGPVEDTLWVAFETQDVDDDATYGVESYPADPNYAVGLTISGNFGMFSSDMTAEKAEQLGHQLIDAAREGR